MLSVDRCGPGGLPRRVGWNLCSYGAEDGEPHIRRCSCRRRAYSAASTGSKLRGGVTRAPHSIGRSMVDEPPGPVDGLLELQPVSAMAAPDTAKMRCALFHRSRCDLAADAPRASLMKRRYLQAIEADVTRRYESHPLLRNDEKRIARRRGARRKPLRDFGSRGSSEADAGRAGTETKDSGGPNRGGKGAGRRSVQRCGRARARTKMSAVRPHENVSETCALERRGAVDSPGVNSQLTGDSGGIERSVRSMPSELQPLVPVGNRCTDHLGSGDLRHCGETALVVGPHLGVKASGVHRHRVIDCGQLGGGWAR